MDEADRAYRADIGTLLPAVTARALLAAMSSFRAQVRVLRERTAATCGYGDFDPLDTYIPSIPESHAQAVRAANAADIARSEVARLRAEVNTRIGGLLEKTDIEALTSAKRLRNAAFDRAIREAVPDSGDALATQLLLLADGWY